MLLGSNHTYKFLCALNSPEEVCCVYKTHQQWFKGCTKPKLYMLPYSQVHKRHRITECSGLEGTSVGHLVHPPAEAGSPRVGCTGPCPGGSWISPEKENPQPLWAACSSAPKWNRSVKPSGKCPLSQWLLLSWVWVLSIRQRGLGL